MGEKGALEGIKILEYGNFIATPLCVKLMADLGAEVVKIEVPGEGDRARRAGPFLNSVPHPERSGLYLYLNTNKLGITLNLEKPTGRKIFTELIKQFDILVEDTKPGGLASIGLGYNDLRAVNTSLIMTSITPFGQTGPYRDYKGCDLLGFHMGGIGYNTPRFAGTEEQQPLKAEHIADHITGITAAVATMCALRARRQIGFGQQVDVSEFEAAVLSFGVLATYYSYEGWSLTRASKAEWAPSHFLKCKDGWIQLSCFEEHQWQNFIEVMGNPDWADAELFKTGRSRGEYWSELEQLMSDWLMKHTKKEIYRAGQAKRVPVAPVNTVSEAVESEQFRERGFFTSIEHPEAGEFLYPGAPYKLSLTHWRLRRPAPLLGQHNVEIYCDRLGYTKEDLVKMRQAGII